MPIKAGELIDAALAKTPGGDLELELKLPRKPGKNPTKYPAQKVSRWRHGTGPHYAATIALLEIAGWLNMEEIERFRNPEAEQHAAISDAGKAIGEAEGQVEQSGLSQEHRRSA